MKNTCYCSFYGFEIIILKFSVLLVKMITFILWLWSTILNYSVFFRFQMLYDFIFQTIWKQTCTLLWSFVGNVPLNKCPVYICFFCMMENTKVDISTLLFQSMNETVRHILSEMEHHYFRHPVYILFNGFSFIILCSSIIRFAEESLKPEMRATVFSPRLMEVAFNSFLLSHITQLVAFF